MVQDGGFAVSGMIFYFLFFIQWGGSGGIWYILFLPPLVSDVKDIFNIKGHIQY